MEKITIEINTDNAAFDPFGPEVARILRALADKCENYTVGDNAKLRDTNGNVVGTFKYEETKQEV